MALRLPRTARGTAPPGRAAGPGGGDSRARPAPAGPRRAHGPALLPPPGGAARPQGGVGEAGRPGRIAGRIGAGRRRRVQLDLEGDLPWGFALKAVRRHDMRRCMKPMVQALFATLALAACSKTQPEQVSGSSAESPTAASPTAPAAAAPRAPGSPASVVHPELS